MTKYPNLVSTRIARTDDEVLQRIADRKKISKAAVIRKVLSDYARDEK